MLSLLFPPHCDASVDTASEKRRCWYDTRRAAATTHLLLARIWIDSYLSAAEAEAAALRRRLTDRATLPEATAHSVRRWTAQNNWNFLAFDSVFVARLVSHTLFLGHRVLLTTRWMTSVTAVGWLRVLLICRFASVVLQRVKTEFNGQRCCCFTGGAAHFTTVYQSFSPGRMSDGCFDGTCNHWLSCSLNIPKVESRS